LPVNYALRGATYDLSQFEDFDEVITQFSPSAMTPYEFNGGYYALPNTHSFLMLFYRTDIFAAQGWDVPATWTDVINLIPELQIQNLKF
jgi:ABC-type glycerol-3-phosphate transport system substrate-binding protein